MPRRSPFKAARQALSRLFSGWGGSGWGRLRFLLPGSQYDWEMQAGHLERNSAVASCLRWVLCNSGEPELVVKRVAGKGSKDPLPNHRLVQLWNEPNPMMDRWDFRGWIDTYTLIDGNGFAFVERSRGNRPVALWPLHTPYMSPIYPEDGSRWLDGWNYRLNGTEHFLRTEDVLHFKWGYVDRFNDRLYCSSLKAALREVCTDNEILGMEAALAKNSGIPALAIIPNAPGEWIERDQAIAMKEQYRENFSADNAGDVFVPLGPVKLEKVGYSPAEMNLDLLHRLPEARIAGTLGIPPMVAGLLLGEGNSTGGQYGTARREARAAAYQDCLIPLQKRQASTLQRQLLPQLASNADMLKVEYDYSDVECLSESRTDKQARDNAALLAGGIMRSEWRAEQGLPATKDDEVYYLPRGVTVVTGDNFPVASVAEDLTGDPDEVTDVDETLDDAPDGDTPKDVEETQAAQPDTAKKSIKAEGEQGHPFTQADLDAAQALVDRVLDSAGHTEAWHAGTLTLAERHGLVHTLIETVKPEFRADAERLVADLLGGSEEKSLTDRLKAKAKAWGDSLKSGVRKVALAAALVMGGPKVLSVETAEPRPLIGAIAPGLAIVEAVGRIVAKRSQDIDGLVDKIVAEEQPPNGQIPGWAEGYAGTAWGAGEATRQVLAMADGLTEERSILDPSPHDECSECPEEADRGFVPIGTLKAIGDRTCRDNCRCQLEFR